MRVFFAFLLKPSKGKLPAIYSVYENRDNLPHYLLGVSIDSKSVNSAYDSVLQDLCRHKIIEGRFDNCKLEIL